MLIKNSRNTYGVIIKILHLVISIGFILQFILVYWRRYIPDTNPSSLQLILLHKSIGFSLLFIGLFFITLRLYNIKPQYSKSMAKFETKLATATHLLLYTTILLLPLTGTLMSLLSGKTILWFGVSVPLALETNKSLAGLIYTSHVWISYLVIGLVGLHTAGAFKHYLINKDKILQRMFFVKN